MKKGIIIQARIDSTRLRGKVLLRLPFGSNTSVIETIIRRCKKTTIIDSIILATTRQTNDDILEKIAISENIKIFRGSENNVLERFYCAAKKENLDTIIRITADNPCIDPILVDNILRAHIEGNWDYTTTEGYPVGLGIEVFNFDALEEAYKNATKYYEKEHVTPYIYRNPQKFKINIVKALKELYAPDIRITLDTEEDYALLCAVFDYLYPKDKYFNAYDIVNLFNEKPWLKLINKKIIQKKIFNNLQEEIKEAIKILDLQDLKRARDFLKGYLSK
ncbi:MAG: acylneuraminate cytidylyltransferase [Thermoplasmata archaeon]|nr:MAG: acylneuraminate cytidylyltransferase [Thermoplasmata archaeon]